MNWMARMTRLEPAASGVTGRYLRVMQGKLVACVLNTAHRLPPIPTQKLQQPSTINCSVPSCYSFSSSCLLILTSQSPFHRFCRAVQPWPLFFFGLVNKGRAYLTPMLSCVALQSYAQLPCCRTPMPGAPYQAGTTVNYICHFYCSFLTRTLPPLGAKRHTKLHFFYIL